VRRKENFYYSCIYDLLKKPVEYPKLNEKVKYCKAKILRLHGKQLKHLQADLHETTTLHDEQLSLHHIIGIHKRRKTR
jgi:hypothetical protein